MKEYLVLRSVSRQVSTMDSDGQDHLEQQHASGVMQEGLNELAVDGWEPRGGPFWDAASTLCVLLSRELACSGVATPFDHEAGCGCLACVMP